MYFLVAALVVSACSATREAVGGVTAASPGGCRAALDVAVPRLGGVFDDVDTEGVSLYDAAVQADLSNIFVSLDVACGRGGAETGELIGRLAAAADEREGFSSAAHWMLVEEICGAVSGGEVPAEICSRAAGNASTARNDYPDRVTPPPHV